MKLRFLWLLALVGLLAVFAACGGGDDDDDDDDGGDGDDNGSQDSDDIGRTDSSSATGTLTVAGKDYKLDMETCQVKGRSDLTVLAGTLEGEEDSDFSASGVNDMVSIAVRFGDTGYIGVGAQLKLDGKSVSYDGDVINPADPGKPVKLKFAMKC